MFRGRQVRKEAEKLKADKEAKLKAKEAAATTIIFFRGYKGRQEFKRERRSIEEKNKRINTKCKRNK